MSLPGRGFAFNAGFESMTNGFTHWLITRRRTLFRNASPHVASFWLMHMVEETEHKTVAFDAYMAYSGAWLPRAIGVLHGSFHVLGYGVVGMFTGAPEGQDPGQSANSRRRRSRALVAGLGRWAPTCCGRFCPGTTRAAKTIPDG